MLLLFLFSSVERKKYESRKKGCEGGRKGSHLVILAWRAMNERGGKVVATREERETVVGPNG